MNRQAMPAPWQAWLPLLVVSALLVAVSIVWEVGGSRSSWLLPLQLATELNPATWWSGSLNLLTGLFAYEHASADGEQSRRGWYAFAALFVLFSVTEIGSIHERLDGAAVVGFGLLLGVLYVVGLVSLWPRPERRRFLYLVTAALGVVAVTTLQEHAKGFGTWLDAADLLPVAVEESVEVVAALAVLFAVSTVRGRFGAAASLRAILPQPQRMEHLRGVVASSAVVHVAVSLFVSPWLEIGQQGDPAVWFPSAAFLLLFLGIAWEPPTSPGSAGVPWRGWWALAMSVVVVSALSVASAARFERYGVPLPARHLMGILSIATLVVFWRERRRVDGGYRFLFVGATLPLLADMVFDVRVIRYLVVGLIPAILILFEQRRWSPSPSRSWGEHHGSSLQRKELADGREGSVPASSSWTSQNCRMTAGCPPACSASSGSSSGSLPDGALARCFGPGEGRGGLRWQDR